MDIYRDLLLLLESNKDMIGRLTLAALLGGLFGLEREIRGREAGLRTNILIATAACLFTYLGIEGFPYPEGSVRDPARIAAQVVSGVGFLGAGALLVYKNKVRGMTTAATVWMVSAVGMAAGAGAGVSAIFATLLALGSLILLGPISRKLEHQARDRYEKRKAVDALRSTPQVESEGDGYWLEEDTD